MAIGGLCVQGLGKVGRKAVVSARRAIRSVAERRWNEYRGTKTRFVGSEWHWLSSCSLYRSFLVDS